MKLRTYKLRFIKDDSDIKVGMNVGRHNLMPINKYDFGYLESIKDESLGFRYGIREFDSGKLFHHHISTIQPILPILISEDNISKGDKFYLDNGTIHTCTGVNNQDGINLPHVTDENGQWHIRKYVSKVIATSDQFGWAYNEGPPHDHNYQWHGKYLESYIPTMLHNTIMNNCKLNIIVEEICPHYGGKHIGKDCSCKSGFILVPKLYEGKIIMDSYGILKTKK